MTEENSESTQSNVAVSMPIGAAAAVLALGVGAAIYLLTQKDTASTATSALSKMKPGKRTPRKLGLSALVALIENDTTRKLLVVALKAMAKRS